jgi:hypothetical protein
MMPDREKVIKGLYDIGGFIAGRVGFEQARNFMRTIDDAIAMLQEQENASKRNPVIVCPHCGKRVK